MLEIWSDDGRLFTAVYLYKSRLSRLRLVPDFGGLLSHSGVVMEHALPLPGARSRFLRLDFGQDGLEIVASGHLPIIEDQINWSEDPFLEFLHADIAPGHGDPMALANLLEQLHGVVQYHLVFWNCHHFSTLVWRHFIPQLPAHIPAAIFPVFGGASFLLPFFQHWTIVTFPALEDSDTDQ